MRRVDHELAPDGILLGETVDHDVERVGEGAHLGRPLDRRRGPEVALGGALRGFCQSLDRSRDPPREERAECDRGKAGHDRGNDKDPRDARCKHLAGVLGRVTGGDHERGKCVGAHAHHADSEDRERDGHDGEGRQDDPGRDAVGSHRDHRAAASRRRRSTRPAAR